MNRWKDTPTSEETPEGMGWCSNMTHKAFVPIEQLGYKRNGSLYKTCIDCREIKRQEYAETPAIQTQAKANANRYYWDHREAALSGAKQRRLDDPEAVFERRLRRQFNWTLDQYNGMLETQNGVCAICERVNANGNRLSIDHDHACCPGKKSCGACVRGLLCSACNTGIGNLQDDYKIVLTAAAYLERYHASL